MRTFEKDYEYLLLNLIPQHRLGLERRKHLERAIRDGEPADMKRAAVHALEELCKVGYYRRADTQVRQEHVLLTYVRRRGRYQVKLQIPVADWLSLGATAQDASPPAVDSATGPVGVDTTFNILPHLIRSLSINDRRESTFDRLESIMRLLPEWLSVWHGRLMLNEERFGVQENRGSWVFTLPERALLKRAVYERCRRSGKTEFVGLPAARALGIAEPPLSSGLDRSRADAEVAITPIFSLGDFWGILEIWFSRSSNGSIMRSRVEVATGMIEQVIENTVRLENLTSVDKLTGVYNRNFYDAQVRIEIERATRSASKLSMLILDIDDFKRVNDTLGHRKGDEALFLVADLIKKNLRKIDMAFRYGGEEFVALLPGTSEEEAAHTAERLRAVIAESDQLRDPAGGRVHIRVSIGGAVYPDHATSEEELFAKADSALYRAKRRGKNRVEFYHES
ncbi:MAG: GGDEF domain-containing protein [Candidatus Krumholzibacteria bacterium]|nr:GGDEF domain-containing protein [Candidatus Krumholzibacteria bacterium]